MTSLSTGGSFRGLNLGGSLGGSFKGRQLTESRLTASKFGKAERALARGWQATPRLPCIASQPAFVTRVSATLALERHASLLACAFDSSPSRF